MNIHDSESDSSRNLSEIQRMNESVRLEGSLDIKSILRSIRNLFAKLMGISSPQKGSQQPRRSGRNKKAA